MRYKVGDSVNILQGHGFFSTHTDPCILQPVDDTWSETWPCMLDCGNEDCIEWDAISADGKLLCHVSECVMRLTDASEQVSA